MPKSSSNKSKIQRNKNGQVTITIPRGIADFKSISPGEEIEWIDHPEGLLLRRIKLE